MDRGVGNIARAQRASNLDGVPARSRLCGGDATGKHTGAGLTPDFIRIDPAGTGGTGSGLHSLRQVGAERQ